MTVWEREVPGLAVGIPVGTLNKGFEVEIGFQLGIFRCREPSLISSHFFRTARPHIAIRVRHLHIDNDPMMD